MAMPKMPMAVQQVLKLFQDQEVDLGALIKTIEFDPGLTINILSVANSPYFGGLSNITTVRDAVVRLGARKIFQMVIAVGVVPYTKSEVKGYGLGSGELLRHSIAVALASQLLAKELGVEPPPHTFTSGLLVNIGKVAMDSFLEVDAEPILEKAHQELIPFEEAASTTPSSARCCSSIGACQSPSSPWSAGDWTPRATRAWTWPSTWCILGT